MSQRVDAARPARAGDVCVLFLSSLSTGSRPPELERLHRAVGGHHVRPLHLTLERCASEGRTTELISALEEIRPALMPVSITATGALPPFESGFYGGNILKLAVSASDDLCADLALVRAALRSAGFRSVHPDDHWQTVTVLEGIDGPSLSEDAITFPFELFRADRLVVSRIETDWSYQNLYELDLGRPKAEWGR